MGSSNEPTPLGFDEIWKLQVSGTVAQNIQDAKGRWTKLASPSIKGVAPKFGAAGLSLRTAEGAVTLGVYGGCTNATKAPSVMCATSDAHLISPLETSTWSNISTCPSARFGGNFVPNLNPFFSEQAFLLFGLSPNKNSSEIDALDNLGEIGILDLSQGVWSRVLPSCDPSSIPKCPVAREGAAIITSSGTIAGIPSSSSSDILIFGGKDINGNFLNDLWVLRSTTARITSSNQTDWGGQYGDGVLGFGPDQNGNGVTDQVGFLLYENVRI